MIDRFWGRIDKGNWIHIRRLVANVPVCVVMDGREVGVDSRCQHRLEDLTKDRLGLLAE